LQHLLPFPNLLQSANISTFFWVQTQSVKEVASYGIHSERTTLFAALRTVKQLFRIPQFGGGKVEKLCFMGLFRVGPAGWAAEMKK